VRNLYVASRQNPGVTRSGKGVRQNRSPVSLRASPKITFSSEACVITAPRRKLQGSFYLVLGGPWRCDVIRSVASKLFGKSAGLPK
jgi:hypothetical protein